MITFIYLGRNVESAIKQIRKEEKEKTNTASVLRTM